MPVQLDLAHIDQLTEARKKLVDKPRGRPPLQNGETLGLAVQRSAIVLMSAVLQSFVEDVFLETSKTALAPVNRLTSTAQYEKSYNRNGNPNPDNIERLFLRLGIENVLDGLSWRKCTNETVRRKLNTLNQLRNGIAHGRTNLTIDGQAYVLRQVAVSNYRNFLEQFGARFEGHVRAQL